MCPRVPGLTESRLNSHIGHIIVIQKITIKTRQEQLLTDAETRVLARDEWQESATIPAPGSYKDAHRRSYGIATAPVQYYDRPRRPTGARPRAGYGLRAGRDGVSLPRRLSRGSACVARRAAGAGPLFRVTAPTR